MRADVRLAAEYALTEARRSRVLGGAKRRRRARPVATRSAFRLLDG
jgi:hypothetical protein